MGWRFGEVWLDTDMLWFREQPRHPFGGLALAMPAAADGLEPVLFMPVATGLEASRRRRLEWQAARRRRLATRTVPAVALVLGSATMLPIAALRQGGGGRDAGPLQADPPSLTLRLDGTRLEVPGLHAPSKRASPRRTPESRTPARATELARVEWDRATSVGLQYSGRLVDGTQLPVEGADWVTWNPVTDSTPNLPSRLHGHERTIRTILSVVAAYRTAHADAPRVVVGDISLRAAGAWTSTCPTRTGSTWTCTTRVSTGTRALRGQPARSTSTSRRISSTASSPRGHRSSSSATRPGSGARAASSSRTRTTRTTCTCASRFPADGRPPSVADVWTLD